MGVLSKVGGDLAEKQVAQDWSSRSLWGVQEFFLLFRELHGMPTMRETRGDEPTITQYSRGPRVCKRVRR